jgi:predicted deacylase
MSLEALRDIHPGVGAMEQGWVDVPGISPPWRLPVVVVRGANQGITLAMIAGVHACEYAPMEALRRFVQSIDPTKLKGTVVAVLLVNTPGFPTRTVFVNPRDGENINDAFPGSTSGSSAERVADFLFTELITKADAFVDCHCGDMVESAIPFTLWTRTGNTEVDAKSQKMATAYGESLIFEAILEDTRGMPRAEAAALGIPSMVAAIGQEGICDDASVEMHLRGMQNILKVLGMVVGPTVGTEPRLMAQILAIRATSSGCFHPHVSLGDTVRPGQKIGEVSDVFGEVLEEPVSPKSGLVMCMLSGLAVNAGEVVVEVGG